MEMPIPFGIIIGLQRVADTPLIDGYDVHVLCRGCLEKALLRVQLPVAAVRSITGMNVEDFNSAVLLHSKITGRH